MQTSVQLLRMEAKYMATTVATQEALWQSRLLQQLGMNITPLIVICKDSKAAIVFSDHHRDHRTTKRINTRVEFIWDHITMGDIKLEFVTTQEQLADAMTKPLLYAQHSHVCINQEKSHYSQ
jgi:hypothetical protein